MYWCLSAFSLVWIMETTSLDLPGSPESLSGHALGMGTFGSLWNMPDDLDLSSDYHGSLLFFAAIDV
jgi:hypothetical protein